MYLRDGSALTITRAATLRQKLQIKVAISPNRNILIPGQPVPVLTIGRQASGRIATGVQSFNVSQKIPVDKAGIEPWACRSRGGRFNLWASEAVHARRPAARLSDLESSASQQQGHKRHETHGLSRPKGLCQASNQERKKQSL